jgi:hypothetical protein
MERNTLPKLQIDPCFGLSLSLLLLLLSTYVFVTKQNLTKQHKKGLGGGFSEIQERASSKHREVLLGGGSSTNADAFAVNPYLCS